MPVLIRNSRGVVVSKSRNLAGLRRRLGGKLWPAAGVTRVRIYHHRDGRGHLFVRFTNGDYCSCEWASYAVLCLALRNWRNLHGARLLVGAGVRAGTVEYTNRVLAGASQ